MIPRVLHQVWVGSDPPEWIQQNWKIWDESLDDTWSVRRWTNGSLPHVEAIGQAYDQPPVGICDLMRVWIGSNFGGVYMDSDYIPLRPLNELTGDRHRWVGTRPGELNSYILSGGAFGFPPADPFMAALWDHGEDALRRGLTNPHFIVGPRSFRAIARRFPVDELMGFPFLRSDKERKRMEQGGSIDLDWLREQYPDAYVIHI